MATATRRLTEHEQRIAERYWNAAHDAVRRCPGLLKAIGDDAYSIALETLCRISHKHDGTRNFITLLRLAIVRELIDYVVREQRYAKRRYQDGVVLYDLDRLQREKADVNAIDYYERDRIRYVLTQMPIGYADVLRLRHGIGDGVTHSQEELAKRYGVTRQAIQMRLRRAERWFTYLFTTLPEGERSAYSFAG